jgi:CubicO group peptidase (beta-lactamase class C family)
MIQYLPLALTGLGLVSSIIYAYRVTEERDLLLSFNQKGALIGFFALALSSLSLYWVNLATLGSAMDPEMFEMTIWGTLTALFWILGPLYFKRVQWGYIAGIVVILGQFMGFVYGLWQRVYIFSFSIYNLSVLVIYLTALATLYFSFRSLGELPKLSIKKIGLGVMGVILVTSVLGAAFSYGSTPVRLYMFKSAFTNIGREIEELTFEEKIEYLVEKGEFISLSAGIVVNNTLIWNRGYGADSVETVYQIGSISKTFVSTAILQLYEQGLIGLDDDINNYLPFTVRHPEYPDKPITINMLLTHQSGMSDYADLYDGFIYGKTLTDWLRGHVSWRLEEFDPIPSQEEFLEGYLTLGGAYYSDEAWFSMEPGTGYHYSNVGYDLLAYLCGRVTNQNFTEYLQDSVLDPMGMTNTGFKASDFPGRQAVPHERIYGLLSRTIVELPVYEKRNVGAGGIKTTVPDMARVLSAHINGGEFDGFQLLMPETVAQMHEEAVQGSADFMQVGYGMGFTRLSEEPWYFWEEEYDMRGAVGHGGGNWGISASMYFVTEEEGGYGIILMTNTRSTAKFDEVWALTVYHRIQIVLMREAYERFTKPMYIQ